jgi:hypothetical protein
MNSTTRPLHRAAVAGAIAISLCVLPYDPALAEVGGTITAAAGATDTAYFGNFGAAVPMDISIDNNKGGQVAVTLTWCDAQNKSPMSLTVNPGLSEGRAIMFGGGVTLPAPGPTSPCNGGLTQALIWSCAKSASPKSASCKFEFKVERHCLCTTAAQTPPPIIQPLEQKPQ